MSAVHLVLRSGGWCTTEYVARVTESILRHHRRPDVRVVCHSDVPEVARIPGVTWAPLVMGWPGWLSKLEVFRGRFVGPDEASVYLDLDTIVRGPLDELLGAAQVGRLGMLRDFFSPAHPASGVMVWRGRDWHCIFEQFGHGLVAQHRTWSEEHRGDAGWIERCVGAERIWLIQDRLPGAASSYKLGSPLGTVVCFHGRPRPHEVGWRPEGGERYCPPRFRRLGT